MLTPAPCLTLGPGTSRPGLTCTTISTTVVPMPAPHTPTTTDATSRDVAPRTPAWTSPNSPAADRTALNHLRALAIPPAATPEYLAHHHPLPPLISPSWHPIFAITPTNLLCTTSYLASEGFKLGYTSPWSLQEFPNLPSAEENCSVTDSNM